MRGTLLTGEQNLLKQREGGLLSGATAYSRETTMLFQYLQHLFMWVAQNNFSFWQWMEGCTAIIFSHFLFFPKGCLSLSIPSLPAISHGHSNYSHPGKAGPFMPSSAAQPCLDIFCSVSELFNCSLDHRIIGSFELKGPLKINLSNAPAMNKDIYS